ncbi:hypothetical protein H4218_002806 [Coemansia sp. IMI 209128]|nr:hypothetical protein H4218_002806 [Coemansia sp. IMI 209128]
MKRATEKQSARPVATSGVKVQRYFPGKAPDATEHNLSASESEDEDKVMSESGGTAALATAAATSALRDVDITGTRQRRGDDGSIASESDDGSDSEVERVLQARLRARRRQEDESSSDSSGSEEDENRGRTSAAQHAALARHEHHGPMFSTGGKASITSDGNSEENVSSSEDSYSESSGSESEHDAPPMLKPIFVPRSQRQAQADRPKGSDDDQSSNLAPEEATAESERLARREESVRMAAVEAARAREAPEINTSNILDLDDTDDIDVEAEFEAWRQRELLRIKREKDAREAVDLEEAERERRNNMSEGEKYAEDMERIRNQRRERRAL